jgi:hypothetical protein
MYHNKLAWDITENNNNNYYYCFIMITADDGDEYSALHNTGLKQ